MLSYLLSFFHYEFIASVLRDFVISRGHSATKQIEGPKPIAPLKPPKVIAPVTSIDDDLIMELKQVLRKRNDAKNTWVCA